MLHHLLRLFKLVQQAVHFLNLHACSHGNTALATGLDQFWLAAFVRRHAVNNALNPLGHFFVATSRHIGRRFGKLGRQLVHQCGHTTHLTHLGHLGTEVIEIKTFTRLDLLRHGLRLIHIHLLRGGFDQRQNIAHAKDTGGHTIWIKRLQTIQFFSHANKLDRLTGDGTHR